MKSSVVVAFLVGAAFASGIVYVAVRPKPEPVTPLAAVQPIVVDHPPVEAQPTPSAPEVQKASPVAPVPAPVPIKTANKAPSKKSYVPQAPKPVVVASRRLPLSQAIEAELPAQDPTPTSLPIIAELQPPAVSAPQTLQPSPAPPPVTSAPPPVPTIVTLRAGASLDVRIGETLSSKRSRAGDTFLATLTGPLVVDGWVIAERGARVEGRVVESDPGGRIHGTATLSVQLVRLTTSDGQHIPIQTEPIDKKAEASTGEEAAKVGGGAVLGAIIGAIAGGGKGAGIGAGAGGAAGAGDVLLTRGKPAQIPVESRLRFRVTNPVEITEKESSYR